jgi:flavin-dependent dehydrogenase
MVRVAGGCMRGDREIDILIVGGGTGGVAAALSALRLGKRVILTEETSWIGGQFTAQGVPPDEHPWIEGTGCTAMYQRLRWGIRDYYRRNYPLLPEARFDNRLNPGQGRVSPLCHEPRVALAVMYQLLAPYLVSSQIEILPRYRPVRAETDGDRVTSVILANSEGEAMAVRSRYVLDATELGDVIALSGAEHVIGAESQKETGEPHALPGEVDPLDQQAITACFAIDYLPGEDHVINRPADYNFWRNYRAQFWPGPQLGWVSSIP